MLLQRHPHSAHARAVPIHWLPSQEASYQGTRRCHFGKDAWGAIYAAAHISKTVVVLFGRVAAHANEQDRAAKRQIQAPCKGSNWCHAGTCIVDPYCNNTHSNRAMEHRSPVWVTTSYR